MLLFLLCFVCIYFLFRLLSNDSKEGKEYLIFIYFMKKKKALKNQAQYLSVLFSEYVELVAKY